MTFLADAARAGAGAGGDLVPGFGEFKEALLETLCRGARRAAWRGAVEGALAGAVHELGLLPAFQGSWMKRERRRELVALTARLAQAPPPPGRVLGGGCALTAMLSDHEPARVVRAKERELEALLARPRPDSPGAAIEWQVDANLKEKELVEARRQLRRQRRQRRAERAAASGAASPKKPRSPDRFGRAESSSARGGGGLGGGTRSRSGSGSPGARGPLGARPLFAALRPASSSVRFFDSAAELPPPPADESRPSTAGAGAGGASGHPAAAKRPSAAGAGAGGGAKGVRADEVAQACAAAASGAGGAAARLLGRARSATPTASLTAHGLRMRCADPDSAAPRVWELHRANQLEFLWPALPRVPRAAARVPRAAVQQMSFQGTATDLAATRVVLSAASDPLAPPAARAAARARGSPVRAAGCAAVGVHAENRQRTHLPGARAAPPGAHDVDRRGPPPRADQRRAAPGLFGRVGCAPG